MYDILLAKDLRNKTALVVDWDLLQIATPRQAER
jgi:hypothetical protein